MDGTINFDKLYLALFNRVAIENFSIVGLQNDTLVSAQKVAIHLSLKDLFLKGEMTAKRVNIRNGIFNFIEEDSNKRANLDRIFRTPLVKDTTKGEWPSINIKELRIQDYRFNYQAFTKRPQFGAPGCMNYDDIGVSEINLRISDIQTRPKKGITAIIHSLNAKEKGGLDLKNLSAEFSLDKDATTFSNLTLRENYSEVKAKKLIFSYDSGKDLKYYVQKIKMDADFVDTYLNFNTIGLFSPNMQNNNLSLYLNGRVYGPVVHLQSSMLKVRTPSNKTSVTVAFSMKGLPSIEKTVFDAHILDLQSESVEIDQILGHFSKEAKPILTPLVPDAKFKFQGNMLGTLFDFEADGMLNSTVGDLVLDVTLNSPGFKKGMKATGDISTVNLNLGDILNTNILGQLSSRIKASVGLNHNGNKGLDLNIASLKIDKLGVNDYNYSDIIAVGQYDNDIFDGRIISHDPNLSLLFQGVISLSEIKQESIYDFYADIAFADLKALNLVKGDNPSQIKLKALANINSDKNNNLIGNIDINNITYWGDQEYNFGAVTLTSLFQDNDYNLNLTAPFINVDYASTLHPNDFVAKASDITVFKPFSHIFSRKNPRDSIPSGNTELKIITYDTQDLCDILMPEIYVADSTQIAITLDQSDSLKVLLDSDRLAFGNNYMKDVSIELSNPDSLIVLDINSNTIGISNAVLDKGSINVVVDSGKVDFDFNYDNRPRNHNHMSFNSLITFERNSDERIITKISLDRSDICLKSYQWDIAPSTISLGKKYFSFDNFSIRNNEQLIGINGCISENPLDSTSIVLNNFDLSMIGDLLKKPIHIDGTITGNAQISDIYGVPSILMDLKGGEISLMERSLGELDILSKWDQNQKRMNILVMNDNEGQRPLELLGYYHPRSNYVNLKLSMKEFGLSYLEPFMENIMSNTGGSISGDIELSGKFNNFKLRSSNTVIHNFSFTPNFTKVPYVITGPVIFNDNTITLNELKVTDRYNNEGVITGTLKHSSFKDMSLDIGLSFRDLECLNTSEKDNSTFYGDAFASGNIRLTGPINNLKADVGASTGARTSIHIPLSSAASAKKEDLLTFTTSKVQKIDPYITRMAKRNKKAGGNKSSNFALQAKANITSDAELLIEINKQLGDILKCKGNGTLDINIDPSKSITDIKGDYTIDEGSYKFVLMGITAKDFIIDNGGTINFNGDIKNTNLNIGATYRTKASVSTLISDTSAVGNRRVVDCGIKMNGALTDPTLKFSIDIQDLDPITKGRVESALSTDDKIQKQFMALLISGSFVPDEQSGIVNNTTILYSNAGEMLANQFNNVFRQLDIPLDLGLNFQPATDGKTHDMFDVALSYQAFNNRVVINGNVGNSQSTQSWGGDFEAEVKLDKRGKMRFKAFTRSADDYSNFLDNTQRHGIGFTFQDEFDNLKELWRNIFWSKKRREEYETKMMLEAAEQLKSEQEMTK